MGRGESGVAGASVGLLEGVEGAWCLRERCWSSGEGREQGQAENGSSDVALETERGLSPDCLTSLLSGYRARESYPLEAYLATPRGLSPDCLMSSLSGHRARERHPRNP